MKLALIPGAYSSPITWAYFKKEMPEEIEKIYLDYNPELPIEDIVKSFEKKLKDVEDDIILVGHSLGGILALSLAQRCKKISKVVTVATPFGGIFISRWMIWPSWFFTPLNSLWRNTHPDNKMLKRIRNREPRVPATCFVVETKNSTMWFEPSDGVVTVHSQSVLEDKKNINHKKIYCTHADSILHQDVIDCIKALLV